MDIQIEKVEPHMYDAQYVELVEKILSWPDWKIQSFCLDQTDLRLLQMIKVLDVEQSITSLVELSTAGE